MPRGHRARAAGEPKLMDMDKAAVVAVEPEAEAAKEEEAEQEETIIVNTVRLSSHVVDLGGYSI
jgi:hypothetical protein